MTRLQSKIIREGDIKMGTIIALCFAGYIWYRLEQRIVVLQAQVARHDRIMCGGGNND